jgi:antirestriction protein ArdC
MSKTDSIEAREQLARAVEEMADSERFGAWLRARAAFHNYSYRNTLLIAQQCSEATQVAGYKAWQKLGRQVRKGERAIRIFAPCTRKVEDTSGDKSGDPRYAVTGFRLAAVFDVSQTDGEDLPTLEYRALDGEAPEELVSLLHSRAAQAGLRVEIRTPEVRGANGCLHRSEGLLVVAEGLSGAMQAKVIGHELGHAFDPWLAEHPDQYRAHRGDCESVAESVAYVICARFGLDAGRAAVGYVASWTSGDAERVRDLAERIDAAVAQILPRNERTEAQLATVGAA